MKRTNSNSGRLFVIICLLNIIVESSSAASSIEGIVDLKSRINRLTLAKSSTNKPVDLFVASTNHLYKIVDYDLNTVDSGKSGLQIEIDLVTGPKLQKQQCAFITESIGPSNSGAQCIKYICGEDEQSTKLSNIVLNGNNKQPKTQQQSNHQQRQLTDNDNRLLLIDERNEHLIECGTIDYGGCRLRSLSDLSIIGCNYSAPVIPFSSASGVVVSSSSPNFDDSSLYLMISNEYDPAERLDKTDFPIFSIRHLATAPSSHHQPSVQRQPLFQTKYPIESMNYDQTIFAPDFHMKIIYSFKHNGFIYFLFTITNKMLSESCNRVDADSNLSGSGSGSSSNQTTASTKIVTRMLRICDSKWSANGGQQQQRLNRDFNTQENIEQLQSLYASASSSATNSAMLTETVLDCEDGSTGQKHHLLQSAHFHEVPNSSDESMLFMTFNSSSSPSTSAVCKLTIKQIDAHFVSMLRKCLDGDNSYAELVSPYSNKYTWKTPCRCSVITDFSRKLPQSDVLNLNERKLFCHNDFFNYMNSRRTLSIKSIGIELPNTKPITSIVTMNVDNENPDSNSLVLILSTLDAQIYMLNFDVQNNFAKIYDQISLASVKSAAGQISLSTSAALNINLVVSQSEMLNATRRSLYVTYDRYLYKINLQNCEQYRTCETCLNGASQNSNRSADNDDQNGAGSKIMPNPFCGWCMYEQKCSTRPECLKKSDHQRSFATESLWLTSSAQNRCPSILSVWPSRYVNPTSSSLARPADNYVFDFNVKLIPDIQYYCDIVTNNLFQRAFPSQQQTTLNRVPANFVNKTTLECDLMPIKAKFEQMTRSSPIRSKFANISLQIRAATNQLYGLEGDKKTSLTTTLISTTNLYTFNCSYFGECSECLSAQLGGSCVWCAKNSKCVFAKAASTPSPFSTPLDTNAYGSECPNEIEFYQASSNSNSNSNSMCTSLQWVSKKEEPSDSIKRLEIAYSAESSLAQTSNGLAVQNPHRNYQLTFKCVFSKERAVSADELHASTSSSYVEWLPEDSATPNMVPFDCRYAPYNDAKQLSADLALQTVYLSLWWSSLPQSTAYHSKSLEGWNQVTFKSIISHDNIISQDQENSQENRSSDFIEISVINCKVKASSCGKCLDAQLIALGCGWCKTNSKCTMEKDCPVSIMDGRPGWMNGRNELGAYCSHPRVVDMQPKCGPKLSAGTRIVLNGENLGSMVKDVQVRMKPVVDSQKQKDFGGVSVNLDDLKCTVLEELYIPASQIVCRTVAPSRAYDHIREYSVYVVTKPSSSASFDSDPNNPKFSSLEDKSELIYRYIEPEIISIEPRKGIKSGGTLLKIVGKNLACGSELTIKFISNSGLCQIVNITTITPRKEDPNRSYSLLDDDSQKESLDEIYCRTPAYNQNEWLMGGTGQKSTLLQTSLQIRLDDYVQIMNSSKFKFEYVDDPRILSVDPDNTIMSGGITMQIRGKGFDSIQAAHLILSTVPISSASYSRLASKDKSNPVASLNLFKSKCNIVNSSLIQCQLPSVKDQRFEMASTQSQAEPFVYYFYMQFNELINKFAYNQANLEQQQLKIYPDPQFEDGQIFSDKAPIILIRGENLLRGVRETDYRVVIGSSDLECNITSITMYFIACLLPNHEELVMTENSQRSSSRLSGVGVGGDTSVIKEPIASASSSLSSSRSYEVRVRIGERFARTIGFIRYERESPLSKYDVVEIKYIIVGACLLSLVLMITMLSCFVVLKRRQNRQIRQLKRMQTEFENLEMRVARECKEAFTELQMDIGELANTLNQTGAPFNDFQTYCVKILFPHASDTDKYYMTSMIDLRMSATNKENVKNGVLMFSQLILNKKFLLTFIHTLEADTHTFLLQDRVNLASYLSICLHDRLDYFTDILMTLLAELIEKLIDTKNNPKILMRRNESVAEKMLTNWFAFLLYDFIRDCAGTPLYILFLSIKQQIYKGPVDAISSEARYSLSEDKLIRQSIDYDTLTIRVQLQDFDETSSEIVVKVLNCDTITQVKEKILDAFFKGFPYSKRPHVDDLDLIFIASEWNKNSRLILYDEDKTSKVDSDDYKRLNTLAHYKIPNGALFLLVSRQSYQLIHSSVNDACNSYTMLDSAKNAENMTLLSKSSKGSSSPPTYSKLSANELNQANNVGNGGGVYSAMNGSSVGLTESIFNTHPHAIHHQQSSQNHHHPHHSTNTSNRQQQSNQVPISTTFSSTSKNASSSQKSKKYHLIKSNDMISNTTPNIKDDKHKQEIAAKLVSEVYLTRLLATKGGMQSYVDDFFESVFSTAHGSNVLPFAIKYLFDFLDEQANLHGISDPDVVYTWKSNSLPLRFWVNIIKNPDFVFDIHKSNIVDASLSVIASTFMDSCSQSKLDLNKESPSGKLLFYKEVHKYRKWVESYYSEIKQMPRFGEQDLNEMLTEESKKRYATFNKNNALYRLYNDYVKKYRVQIENALNNEYQDAASLSVNKHLNYRLQQVIYLMDAIEV